MTVIQPNSISGINSITVAANESLSIHKSDGSLLREIVADTGISTFSGIKVSTGASISDTGNIAAAGIVTANGGVKVAAAATISTNGNATFSGVTTAKAADLQTGPFNVGTAATISANGNATFSGIVTATSYVGDGSALTGIAGTEITDSDFAVGVSTFFVDYSTSNVGINTVVPTAALDVTGDATVSGIVTATTFVTTAGQLGHRNLIINGAMNVAQRGSSATTDGFGTVDRFQCLYDGTDEAPTQAHHTLTSGDTGPWAKGFRHSFQITNGNQTSGAGAADSIAIFYEFEAQDIANSGWNYTSSSSYITLSFWIKASVAQNYYGYVRSIDGTQRAYDFETGSLTADAWTYITKTIPGDSSLQFDYNTSLGFQVILYAFAGTNLTHSGRALNTWINNDDGTRTPDNTSTWYTTNDSDIELTGVQLEVGPVATPFEHRSYADELRRCQRNYQFMHYSNQSYVDSSQHVGGSATFMTQMRNASYTVAQNTAQGGNITSIGDVPSVHVKKEWGLGFYQTATAAGNWYFYRDLTMDAEI